jgi:thioredoxin-related protein
MMKKAFFILSSAALLLSAVAFTSTSKSDTPMAEEKIQWMTFEQAVEANKAKPKKFVIDVYTDWCGWCKVMDRESFTNPDVIKYVNDNYYAVKLNAEQKEDIMFDGKKFSYVAQGRGGYNTFAATLLDGNMGYPTLVYLTERFERVVISPGFKKPDQLLKELRFTGDNIYSQKSWDQYISGN